MLYAVPTVNNGFNIDGPLIQGAADALPWLVNQDGSSSIAAVSLAGSAVTGALKAASFPSLTGDITTTAGSLATTLATVNGNVGTWNNVTVNAKGLVTAGSNVSYQGALTLTTTGSAGAATLIGNTLNVPNYTGTTYTFSTGLTNTAGTVTVNTSQNITTLSNLTSTGFVKTSAAGLLSVDTSTYLTANQNITITGDVTGSGTTAITGTLATVNTNTGSFGSSTAIPTLTVNGKGLITAASAAAVVAPAGTLSGAALNPTVVTSSLTSVGTLASLVVTGSVTAGSYVAGTLGYIAANLLASFQSSVNSYNQVVIQNSSSGTTASSDFVVNNNNSTDTTFYGDFGMNSSGFTGSGSFNLANTVYLSATSGDLVIGTTTANNFRVVVNGLTTDALLINSSQNATFGGSIAIPTSSNIFLTNGSTTGNYIATGSTISFGNNGTPQAGWNQNGFFIRKILLDFGNGDVVLTRRAAATLNLGDTDAASPVAQTLSVQSVAAGNSNVAGANFTQAMSRGTGTGTGGSWILQVASASTTGSTQNALVNALTVDSTKLLTCAGAVTVTGHTTFEGVTSTGATGTGNLVYSNSPTFTTPLLGTPTSGNLSNCTALPASALTSATLGAGVGFSATDYNGTTISSGTYTPATANGNFQYITNGGAFTLAPPSTSCTIVLTITNNGSAGAVTTSGFTKVVGDAFTTTNTNAFQCVITRSNSLASLNVLAMQ